MCWAHRHWLVGWAARQTILVSAVPRLRFLLADDPSSLKVKLMDWQ
jgi:hypothetical protein